MAVNCKTPNLSLNIKNLTWCIIHLIFIQGTFAQKNPLKCNKQLGHCSCELEDGSKIDLSKLANTDNKPRFLNIPDADGADSYSWNPCFDFDIPTITICTGVAVCQLHIDPSSGIPSYYSLGDQNSAHFVTDSKHGLQLVYNAVTNGNRTAFVALQCDQGEEGNMTAAGEDTQEKSTYYMTVKSKHCCAQGGGISVGTILIIIFFVLLLVYVIGGMVFMKFGRGAEGKEVVPNVEFWSEFPLLIRDGFRFLISGCNSDKMYQNM